MRPVERHEPPEQVVQRLDRVGLLQESEGADVVFPPGFTNREGEPLPLIVRKGNGGFNYATSDLACVIDRVERVGATLMLYVVGAPQAQHFEMVWKVCEMAGWLRLVSCTLPLTYAFDALDRAAHGAALDARFWLDVAVMIGATILALGGASDAGVRTILTLSGATGLLFIGDWLLKTM